MPSLTFTFVLEFDYDLNVSLQVGDNAYYNALATSGGFQQNNTSSVMHIGVVTDIDRVGRRVVVSSPHVDQSTGNPLPNAEPPMGSYISFSKSSVVNNNDLTGYYSTVILTNDSRSKAELFSVASGVTESSK